ncbi:hypothetical protein YC2023_061382 [Brassica napus]
MGVEISYLVLIGSSLKYGCMFSIIVFTNTCFVCFSDTAEARGKWKRQMNLEEGRSETRSLRKAAA